MPADLDIYNYWKAKEGCYVIVTRRIPSIEKDEIGILHNVHDVNENNAEAWGVVVYGQLAYRTNKKGEQEEYVIMGKSKNGKNKTVYCTSVNLTDIKEAANG